MLMTTRNPAGMWLTQRRGLISGVRSRLLALRASGYFIADSVIAAACLSAGE